MVFYDWHFTSTFTVELLIVKVYIISALYRYTAKWRHKLQPPPLFTAWKEPLISAFSSAKGAEGSHPDHCKYLADKRFTDRLQRFGKLEPWWIRTLIPPPPSYSFSKRDQLICVMFFHYAIRITLRFSSLNTEINHLFILFRCISKISPTLESIRNHGTVLYTRGGWK